jgi:heme a synthase
LYATFVAGETGVTGARRATGSSLAIAGLIVLTLVQAGFGTQVRGHIETAINAGVAREAALSTAGRLDYLHRDLAFIVLIGAALLTLWLLSRRSTLIRWCYVVLLLAIGQIVLGVLMAYGSLTPAAQVGHLTIASLLLGAETVLWLLSRRQST